ncbi:MAG: hypothetical protein GX946_10285 [Oligosphaeraceae bacterium]|nr:hypothetical protein [Oligosphaeraceae bacterium]
MSEPFFPRIISGQLDRYQLSNELPPLELSSGCILRRFSALDQVSNETVLLEVLPAPYALELLRLLRQNMSGLTSRLERPLLYCWGLPAFIHEVWEIDAAASAATGLSIGDSPLVYALSDPVCLVNMLANGDSEACTELYRKQLPRFCEQLAEAQRQGLAHGALSEHTLWLDAQGALRASDFMLAHQLEQLCQGQDINALQSPSQHDDLLALKKLALRILPLTSLQKQQGDMEALQNADALLQLGQILSSAVRENIVAPSLEIGDNRPKSAQKEPVRKPKHRHFAVTLALLCILLAVLLGQQLWQKRDLLQQFGSSTLQEDAAPPQLLTSKMWQNLSDTFAMRFTLSQTLEQSGPLGLTLLGQLQRLELVWEEQALRFYEQLGKQHYKLLEEIPWTKSPEVGTQYAIVKTPASLAVYQDGVLLLDAALKTQSWRNLKWQNDPRLETAPRLTYQKIGNLYFADDFMHAEGALGEWQVQSGSWALHELQTPVRSANPFSFIGKGDNAEASCGHWFWRNYQVSCAMQALQAPSFGLRICSDEHQNSYRLVFELADENAAVANLRLLKQSKEGEHLLTECSVPNPTGQWIELALSNNEGRLTAFIDRHAVLNYVDKAPLLGGKLSLLSSGAQGVVFDDVLVIPTQRLQLDQESLQNKNDLLFTENMLKDAGTVLHSLTLHQPELVEAELRLQLSVAMLKDKNWELALQHRTQRELLLKLQQNNATNNLQAEVILRKLGKETILSQGELPLQNKTDPMELSFLVQGNEAKALCDGKTLVFVNELPEQEAGYAVLRQSSQAQEKPEWPKLSYAPAPALKPILDRVAMFTHEVSMRSWNNPVMEWRKQGENYWQQSDLWQDFQASMNIQSLMKGTNQPAWGLLMANSSLKYQLKLMYETSKKQLELTVPGQDKLNLQLNEPPENIALQKSADRLLARLNGRLLWNLPMPEELSGLCLLGRAGHGNSEDWANAVNVLGEGVKSYSFQEAPCDWLAAAGNWEVTNRWQCDPRWSFFSGQNLDGVACLWNKLPQGENLSVDFFVGPKMDTGRGKKYEYAGDYALVLCADGQNINSGYSFIFGGWDNRGSQIVRRNSIVKENRDIKVTRSSAIHRQWFHMKIRKENSRLSFWVDGKLVAELDDPEPLKDRYFGIWTWKSEIMVAQLRISSQKHENAGAVLRRSKGLPATPYDE